MCSGAAFTKPWAEPQTATFELRLPRGTGIRVPGRGRSSFGGQATELSRGGSWLSEWTNADVTHAISEDIAELLMELLADGIAVVGPREIRTYLSTFPDLIDIVPIAIEALRRQVPDAKVTLQVYHDPEIEDSYLLVCVRMREYSESVLEAIERAEAEFVDLLRDKGGWIQLTTDFGTAG